MVLGAIDVVDAMSLPISPISFSSSGSLAEPAGMFTSEFAEKDRVSPHKSDSMKLEASPCATWLGDCHLRWQVLLVLLFGMSAHATKNALAPAQPALEQLGLSPLLYALVSASPVLGSICLPVAWGIAYNRYERLVLLIVPLGELIGHLVILTGLLFLNQETDSTGSVGYVLLIVGLLVFSIFHAGVGVVQHTVLSRVLPDGLTSGFVAIIAFTHLTTAACNFAVPTILERFGLTGLQLILLVPSLLSFIAGGLLARAATGFSVPHVLTPTAAFVRSISQHSLAVPLLEDSPLPMRSGARASPRASQGEVQRDYKPSVLCIRGMGIIILLGLWRAIVLGILHAFRTVKNGLLCSYGMSKVSAGEVVGANQTLALLFLPLVAMLADFSGRRALLVLTSFMACCATMVLSNVSAMPFLPKTASLVGALFLISLANLLVPALALSLVPGNSQRSLGRSYGMLEAIFGSAQFVFLMGIGYLRELGGFDYAMVLVQAALGVGVLVSIALAVVATDDNSCSCLSEAGVPELRSKSTDDGVD
eukprot:TRINITY_DN8331_c0_g1_i1.p1 TRINITY_DN8331_c0_g1~~TRINITY_DN8331_c0_g1_i1.p1  ORF type:complete len:535 (+),score=45.60 TRINITY_DN8331_c0_g1_i1:74-1678(+)